MPLVTIQLLCIVTALSNKENPMTKSKDYIEMAFRSIDCFKNGGKLDAKELDSIIKIAERDGVIDHNEIRVLQKIIAKIKPDEVDEAMRRKLAQLAKKIGA